MKFITVAVWSAIFGEIVGYIVSQLSQGTYSFTTVAIVSIIVGEIAVVAIPAISGSAVPKNVTTDEQ
ncbi:YjzD family protein [Leuconostoc miyukkimchii]|uniref:YjzD family protein n=1 Tax=Leuconostoc miyukkimchii TaxID=910540 RepID=UPI001C7DC729|nr:YjzD family protein [Leuconostoc miyukkimchii]